MKDHQRELDELIAFVRKVSSIHDGKPHNKWIRNLGKEAKLLLHKIELLRQG